MQRLIHNFSLAEARMAQVCTQTLHTPVHTYGRRLATLILERVGLFTEVPRRGVLGTPVFSRPLGHITFVSPAAHLPSCSFHRPSGPHFSGPGFFLPRPFLLLPLFPNVLEVEFSELPELRILRSSPARARTYVTYISPPPERMLHPLHGRLMCSSRKG